MADQRDSRGRFAKKGPKRVRYKKTYVASEHNYVSGHQCPGKTCKDRLCPLFNNIQDLGKNVTRDWKEGRRIMELGVLLESLSTCSSCRMGPIPLYTENVIGERRRGLGGYLYVVCMNPDCGEVNMVPYGKTHRKEKATGMPSFVVNTKLGTAMIDSLGGPDRVNNLLSTLNIPTINNKTLMSMQRRAGENVESVSLLTTKKAANDTYHMEMVEVANAESSQASQSMEVLIDDLGVGVLPDASAKTKEMLRKTDGHDIDDALKFDDSDNELPDTDHRNVNQNIVSSTANTQNRIPTTPEVSQSEDDTGTVCTPVTANCLPPAQSRRRKRPSKSKGTLKKSVNQKLVKRFPCKTRRGMTCAVDTAWHKRGFDSLTAHTFFMSKSQYGKKVLKTVVGHRTCGTCRWWRRNRPGLPVRKHRCVQNHHGSARSMKSSTGIRGMKELIDEGTPVEYIEGDGDNTLIASLRSELNLNIKKRFDKNHVVKNIGKTLFELKSKKLSKTVIMHIQKCVKYAFAKNQGNKEGLEENLRGLIPHQFGDHQHCRARFCGFLRKPGSVYQHRSLPYKTALKDTDLRHQLEAVFEPLIANAEQYIDLDSSQQCEHANREVTLRAPKSLHYGNSESIDFKVHATAAFINEGHGYISMFILMLGNSFKTQQMKKVVFPLESLLKTMPGKG
ncbi:uncharacterized protein LOC134252182 [Saccostrea cucullata]|uniref:uncharacterized protein LOC134252182 n=1 Tax=Saccostrea cuccullata TaxID=36930 RepID=UPI002ED3013B